MIYAIVLIVQILSIKVDAEYQEIKFQMLFYQECLMVLLELIYNEILIGRKSVNSTIKQDVVQDIELDIVGLLSFSGIVLLEVLLIQL